MSQGLIQKLQRLGELLVPESIHAALFQSVDLVQALVLHLHTTDHGLAQGRDTLDLPKPVEQGDGLPGSVGVSQPHGAHHHSDTSLHKIRTDEARIIYFTQRLQPNIIKSFALNVQSHYLFLLPLHHETLLQTSLLMLKVDVKLCEGCQL